jgi:peptidyl-prolyl cis-trans isomerase SurA
MRPTGSSPLMTCRDREETVRGGTGNPRRQRRVGPPMKLRLAVVIAMLGLAGVAWGQPPILPQPEPQPEEPQAEAKPEPPPPKAPRKTGKRQVVDRVVAVVNDSVILHSELMRRVAPLTAELDEVSDPRERNRRQDKMKSQVLDEMVNEELIVQAAAESKLEVSAKEVQGALEEIKKQNNLDDNQLAEALRMQGYTMSSYRSDVRRQILRMRATNMLVRPRVTVTDDDVRARYDAMSRRSAAVKRIKLRHILVALPDKPTETQVAEAKRKASDLIEKVRGGADFARLAADSSDDEQTKFSGGELGWIERGSIDTEWEVIVFAMNKGEVRGPITGPRGLHVFQVTEVERNQQKPFAQMKEQLRNEIFRKEMERQTKLWLDELREKAHIQVKL